MGGGGGNRAPGGRGPGGYGRTSAAGGGSDRQAAPKPAPSVFAAVELPDLTQDARSFNVAQDQAENANDSFSGFLAGLFGFEQKASEVNLGEVDTTFSVNPVTFGLGLINPILGMGIGAAGFADGADIEVSSWSEDAFSLSGDWSGTPATRAPRDGGGRDPVFSFTPVAGGSAPGSAPAYSTQDALDLAGDDWGFDFGDVFGSFQAPAGVADNPDPYVLNGADYGGAEAAKSDPGLVIAGAVVVGVLAWKFL